MRHSRLGLFMLPVLFIGCSAGTTPDAEQGSLEKTAVGRQAVEGTKRTNQFKGDVKFTNNPASVVSSHLLPFFTTNPQSCQVYANSVTPANLEANSGSSMTTGTMTCPYELSAETIDGGATYNLFADMAGVRINQDSKVLPLKEVQTPVPLDFEHCPGLARVEFREESCDPGNLGPLIPRPNAWSDWIHVRFNEIDPGNDVDYHYVMLRNGWQESFNVYWGRQELRPDEVLRAGNNILNASGVCDVQVPLCVAIPICRPSQRTDNCEGVIEPPGDRGNLAGPFRVQGHTTSYRFQVLASGPDGRHEGFPGPPYERTVSNPWRFDNVLVGDYTLRMTDSGVGQGPRFSEFWTQYWSYEKVKVGATTMVSAFDIRPAYQSGNIRMRDIYSSNHLHRNLNAGEPTSSPYSGTHIYSYGYPTGGPGTKSWGDLGAYTTFDKPFNAQHELYDTYENILASAGNETIGANARFTMRHNGTNVPDGGYREGSMTLYQQPEALTTLNPGDRLKKDFNVCTGLMKLTVNLVDGETIIDPYVDARGAFNGTDYWHTVQNYTTDGQYFGEPKTGQKPPGTQARVFFPVPAGVYNLTPRGTVISPPPTSSRSNVKFSDFSDVPVTCECDHVCGFDGDVIITGKTENCPEAGPELDISIKSVKPLNAPNPIAKVWYTVEGESPEVKRYLCGSSDSSDCTDPTLTAADYVIAVPPALLTPCTETKVFVNVLVQGGTRASQSDFNVTLPGAACDICHDGAACLTAYEKLDVGSFGMVRADTYAGTLDAKAKTQFTNSPTQNYSLTVNGNATLGQDVTVKSNPFLVDGTCTAATGTCSALITTVLPQGKPTRTITPGTTPLTVTAAAGTTVTAVAAGSYSNVTLQPNANGGTFSLAAGNYNLQSLTVGGIASPKKLYIDILGPVTLNIAGNLSIGQNVFIRLKNGTKDSDVQIFTNGSNVNLGANVSFHGTVIAPNASVNADAGLVYYGCVSGNSVKFGDRSSFYGY